MTDLQYRILDIIFNYKNVAKVKHNNETKGLDIDTITKNDFLNKICIFKKLKYIKTLNKLLVDGYIQKVKIVLDFEGYQLTDFGLKSYNIEKEKREKTTKWYEKPLRKEIILLVISAIISLVTNKLTKEETQQELKRLIELENTLEKRIDSLTNHPYILKSH